ncbi:hypothetical protein AC1031_011456 [Aphanomyces cochlioides]|nr:hypothetical protein AC1031_011456 [Aphanomyces cochlioides]
MELNPLRPVDFELILGMDFLSKAGVVIDTARREMNLPDGEYVSLLTKNIEYVKTFCTYIKLRADVWLSKYAKAPNNSEYWVNRGTKWIPTVCVDEMKKPCMYRITNVSARFLCLKEGTIIGAVAEKGVRPLNQDMVRSTSNKYRGW